MDLPFEFTYQKAQRSRSSKNGKSLRERYKTLFVPLVPSWFNPFFFGLQRLLVLEKAGQEQIAKWPKKVVEFKTESASFNPR